MELVIKKDMENVLGTDLIIMTLKDSNQLLDSVTCGKRTAEKRMSIDF